MQGGGARPLKRCFIFSFSQGISVKDEYYVPSWLSRVNCELSSSTWLLKDRLSLKGGFSRFQQHSRFLKEFKNFHSLPLSLIFKSSKTFKYFAGFYLFVKRPHTSRILSPGRSQANLFLNKRRKLMGVFIFLKESRYNSYCKIKFSVSCAIYFFYLLRNNNSQF